MRILITAVIMFLMLAPSGKAQNGVKLTWDANVETDIAGYKVYWGTASRNYGTPVTIDLQTTYAVQSLAPGKYYFAVTAFNTAGLESGYSNEVSAIVTGVGPLEPLNLRGPITIAVTRYTATIAWTTADVPTDGLVEYGLSATTLDKSGKVQTGSTDHIAQLGNLKGATTYFYRVTSKDANGVVMRSEIGSFITK